MAMVRFVLVWAVIWLLGGPAGMALAAGGPASLEDGFTVHLTAWAEEEAANDLLIASLSVERTGPDSVHLAATVTDIMGQALAEAGNYPQVKAGTTAYSTQPVYQRRDGQSERVGWRIRQTLRLESTEVEATTELIGRLQALDLQLAGLSFSVSPARREAMRESLTAAALDAWQAKAETAIKRLGGQVWRPHELKIQDEQYQPIQPLMRADIALAGEAAAPAVEAGTSQVRVTVSGTAWGR